MNGSCHTDECVMSHACISRVTHMSESCHTYEWDMSHIWIRAARHSSIILYVFVHGDEYVQNNARFPVKESFLPRKIWLNCVCLLSVVRRCYAGKRCFVTASMRQKKKEPKISCQRALCYLYVCWGLHVVLQCTATHCNKLQHAATHCNTLQHNTATPCNNVCWRLRVAVEQTLFRGSEHEAELAGMQLKVLAEMDAHEVCCSVLHCAAVCCSVLAEMDAHELCCSVL